MALRLPFCTKMEEEYDTTMPAMAEDKEQQEKDFLNNLHNLMAQLSEPCREEFEGALQTQDMNSLSDSCKAELGSAAQSTQGFEAQKRQAAEEAAAEHMLANQIDSHTIYYIMAFMFIFVAAVAAYVVWVNQKLKDAGYYSSKKPLSKKKQMKERMKTKSQ